MATTTPTLADLCPATAAVYEKYSKLELETRNPTVRRFFRLGMDEIKARAGGCLCITSTPFTLVVLQGNRVAAQLISTGDGKVRMEPFCAGAGHVAIGPQDARKLLPWAEGLAEKMRLSGLYDGMGVIRAEAWDSATLGHYKEDLIAAGKADGV